jgi:hypothetical protein
MLCLQKYKGKLKDSFEEAVPVLDKPINSSTILLELIIFLQMKK